MFDPFAKPLRDLTAADLGCLREVAEGWYVEYKRSALEAERIAKSLCSFANQYGGWLFLGIDERTDHSGAAGFPGVPAAERSTTEQRIRQAAQAHCSRAPYFETRFVDGPCRDPVVPADRFIAIVRVPPSDDVPHIHSSGRIFRRIGSSSEPHAETDRALLDQLLDRRRQLDGAIRRFTEFRPSLRNIDPTAYVHVYLLTRPNGEYPDRRRIDFKEFVEQLKTGPAAFYDNFYTAYDGYVARAVGRDAHDRPQQTIRYGADDGWAHITLPIDHFDGGHADDPRLRHLEHLREFEAQHPTSGSTLVDLTSMLLSLTSAMSAYVKLLKRSGLQRVPTFYRVAVEGVWRTIPYVDMASFAAHARNHGLAHIDRELLVWPTGDGYRGLSPLGWETDENAEPFLVGLSEASSIFSALLMVMGIDADYVGDNHAEFVGALKRRLNASRSSAGTAV